MNMVTFLIKSTVILIKCEFININISSRAVGLRKPASIFHMWDSHATNVVSSHIYLFMLYCFCVLLLWSLYKQYLKWGHYVSCLKTYLGGHITKWRINHLDDDIMFYVCFVNCFLIIYTILYMSEVLFLCELVHLW